MSISLESGKRNNENLLLLNHLDIVDDMRHDHNRIPHPSSVDLPLGVDHRLESPKLQLHKLAGTRRVACVDCELDP